MWNLPEKKMAKRSICQCGPLFLSSCYIHLSVSLSVSLPFCLPQLPEEPS